MSATDQSLVKASYYRSQLYTAYLGINPLVAAAHPIFSLVERVNLSRQLVFNESLTDIVLHELKAFETRAADANYDGETIIISRYLLTSVIQYSVKQHNLSLPLLQFNAKEENSENCFFDIIERLICKPDLYLDVLELAYLCLSTDLSIHNHKSNEDKEPLKEKLFKIISKHRSFEKKAISEDAPPPPPESKQNNFMLLKTGTLSLLIVGLVFVAGNLFVNNTAKHYLNLNYQGQSSTSWTK
jgi:type IV/VI secretion system ImpK/VasF family protein